MYSGQDQRPSPQPQPVQFEFIGDAFQLLQKQLGAWVGASALISLLSSLFIGPVFGYWIVQLIKHPERANAPQSWFLSGLLTLVGTLLGAGLQHMALKQLRGETISATSFLGAFSRTGSLVVIALVMGLIALLFGALPGLLPLLLTVPHAILNTLLVLAVPLILDQNLAPKAALQESVRVIRQNLWISLAFVLLSSMASMVGFMACGFGVLLSMPLFPLCIALLYRAFYPERFKERG